MNISRGNRKIKAYQTGQATIRKVLVDGKIGYIIIAYFEDWQKAHAIDPSNPIPFSRGKLYPSMGKAWQACNKYCPNIRLFPSVTMPLAVGDFYHNKIADRPADKR